MTTIIAAGKTDIGRRRSSNQDQFLIAEAIPSLRVSSNSLGFPLTTLINGKAQAHIMIVADGMGGHQGGSRAAELTIRIVIDQLCGMTDWRRSQLTPQKGTNFSPFSKPSSAVRIVPLFPSHATTRVFVEWERR